MSRSSENRALDHRILRLAVPAVLATAADPLYDLTDTAVLGHLGRDALAGAALASVIMAFGYAVFVFLLYGTTATIARLVGAGQDEAASHHSVQALWLGLGIGVVVSLAIWPLSGVLIALHGGEGAVAANAGTYLRTSLLGFPAFFLVMAATGSLRGRQDLRTPLVVTSSTVALNLVLELVLIVGLDQGVGASAASTAVAKWISAVILSGVVLRSARRNRVSLCPERAAIRALSGAAFPLFVRTLSLRTALNSALSVAANLGPSHLAAYAIGTQVWSFVAYVCEGFEVAGHTMIGAALGSGEAQAARRVGRRIMRWSIGLGVFAGICIAVGAPWIPHVFTTNESVRQLAVTSLWWVAAMQPVNMIAFGLDGILIGAGDLRFLATSMAAISLIFVAVTRIAAHLGGGLAWLWASLLMLMTLRSVVLTARFRGQRWQRLDLSGSSRPPNSTKSAES